MSIIKLNPDNFENYELVARPEKTFRSSSSGIQGDILLMKDASPSLKDISRKQISEFHEVTQYSDEKSTSLIEEMNTSPEGSLKSIIGISQGLRYQKRQEVFRTIPGAKFNKEFYKKKIIKNVLYPYYRGVYDAMEWAYTNYHCLNFYQDTSVPDNSVLIYPAPTSSNVSPFHDHP